MKPYLLWPLVCALSCGAQSFKGNAIGMSLESFKQLNKGQSVYINTGNPGKRRDKKLDRMVDTPMCTDTLDGFPGADSGITRRPGEVVCNISPGSWNPAARMIGDIDTREILYHFYDGRLYEITLSFRPIQFLSMKAAFTDKFGPPSKSSKIDCQNAFGARWNGESISWRVRTNAIATLYEGCSNGPGQDQLDGYSSGSINDSSLEPPAEAKRSAAF